MLTVGRGTAVSCSELGFKKKVSYSLAGRFILLKPSLKLQLLLTHSHEEENQHVTCQS